MKRILLLAVLCLLSSYNTFSQQRRLDSLSKLAATEKNDTAALRLLVQVAKEYVNTGGFDSAISYSSRAVRVADGLLKRKADSLYTRTVKRYKGSAFNYRGLAFRDMGNFPEALKSLFESLRIAESLKEKYGIATGYNNIGLVYMSQDNHEKALENFYAALKLYTEISFARGMGSANNNIGIILENTGRHEEALKHHFAALKIRDSIGDKKGIAYSYNNIGTVYDNMGRTDDAVKNHQASLEMRQEIGDKSGVAGSLNNLARALMHGKKYGEARKYYLQAQQIAESIGHREFLKHIYGGLANVDSLQGNYASAFRYLKMHHRTRDSIDNEATRRNTMLAQVSYDFEKKEAAQKAEHEKEILVLESENKLQKTRRNYTVIISGLVLLLLTTGFVYYNIRRSLRLREAYTKQLLVAQEKERQRISKELHDSVGQNVLFIKNQMVKMNELSLMPAIDETLNELRSISKDLYPNQLEKYGLVAAVDSLTEKVHAASGIFASHDMSGIKSDLSADEQIQYYRIIQECVTNAVKHSGATALRITAERKSDNTVLNIQDNGKGFDKNILAKKAQRSFGILNLEERVSYLKGKMEIESAPGNGSRFTFTIPD